MIKANVGSTNKGADGNEATWIAFLQEEVVAKCTEATNEPWSNEQLSKVKSFANTCNVLKTYTVKNRLDVPVGKERLVGFTKDYEAFLSRVSDQASRVSRAIKKHESDLGKKAEAANKEVKAQKSSMAAGSKAKANMKTLPKELASKVELKSFSHWQIHVGTKAIQVVTCFLGPRTKFNNGEPVVVHKEMPCDQTGE